jgi:membrane protease subunit HflK
MPEEEEESLSADQRVRSSVSRVLRSGVLLIGALASLLAWAYFGYYELGPGQAAIVLRLGHHARTVTTPGPNFHIPFPIERILIVNVDELRKQEFDFRGVEGPETPREELVEVSMQTGDNNIVRVSFAVQYRIKDAFRARYRIADPAAVVRDASQAAMREIVGRETVDGVLRDRRDVVTADVGELLQRILDSYEAGIVIRSKDVQLLDVQVPAPVRAAFEDVVAANQDASRLVNEAEAFRNEQIPRARAEATELLEAAYGYRDAKIAQATGDSERFKAVAIEYRKAPRVTEKRLYLETMETVLQNVEKVIIEPGTTNVLPYLPLGRNPSGRAP